MPVTIPDEVLRQAGLTEREALIEIACRLFDAGKLALWPAAQLCGLDRVDFEIALADRGLAAYRPTPQDLRDDLATLDRLGI